MMRDGLHRLPEAPETPEHEAAAAIEALEGWAKRVNVTISVFRVTPALPWENREIAAVGQDAKGDWVRNTFSLENLSDPHECDAALIALATARGWAEFRTLS